jgi:iron complex outermembrane recepter protein
LVKLDKQPIAAALLAAWSTAALAAAAAGEEEQQLGEVTVSGAAAPRVPANLPAVSEGVSAQQIEESINLVNTEDALKYLPSIHVRKRFIGDRNGIVATRTSGTLNSARSLVYADGLLLSNLLGNSYSYPPRWSMVAPEEIERIDVIYGPFSALYPGNAIGAVVEMTTRMPEKFEAYAKAQAFHQDFKLYGTDESFGGEQYSAAVGSREGALSWWLALNHLDSEGQPMSFGVASPTTGTGTAVSGAFRDTDPTNAPRVIAGATSIDHNVQDDGKFKLAYDITPTLRAAYTLGYWQLDSDSRVKSYLRDAADNAIYNGKVVIDGQTYAVAMNPSRSEAEHYLHGLELKSRTGGEWDWDAVASLYDYAHDETRSATNYGKTQAGQVAKLDGTGWQTVDLRSVWRPAFAGGSHEASFGYHYDHYELDSRVFSNSDWTEADATTLKSSFAGQTQTQALYAQDAWTFLPAWKLTAGGRLEHWRAYDGKLGNASTTQRYADRDDTFFSPKLAVSFQASEDWALRASLARAYRMPTVSELFQGSLSAGTIVNNDPNLKPEKALSAELTAERALGDKGLLRISLFDEHVEDALIQQTVLGTTNVVTFQNVDRVHSRGVELALQTSGLLPGLDLAASVTYAESIIEEDGAHPEFEGKWAPRVPRWRASATATWHQDDRLAYSLGVRYSGRQYGNLDNSDSNWQTYGASSKFLVVDARVLYKIAKQWSAAVGVENLTDEKYYAFHPYPQRTFLAELKFAY